ARAPDPATMPCCARHFRVPRTATSGSSRRSPSFQPLRPPRRIDTRLLDVKIAIGRSAKIVSNFCVSYASFRVGHRREAGPVPSGQTGDGYRVAGEGTVNSMPTTSAELLLDGFGRVREAVHEVVDSLSADDLAYRVDP